MPESQVSLFATLRGRLRQGCLPRSSSISGRLTHSVAIIVTLTVTFAALLASGATWLQLREQVVSRVQDGQLATQALYEAERQRMLGLARIIAGRPTLCRLALAGDAQALQPYLETLRQESSLDAILLVTGGQATIQQGRNDLPDPAELRAGRPLPFADFIALKAPPRLLIAAGSEIDRTGECAGESPGHILAIQFLENDEMQILAQKTGLEQNLIVTGKRIAASLPASLDWPVEEPAVGENEALHPICCTRRASQGQDYSAGLAPLLDGQGRLVALSETALRDTAIRRGAMNAGALLLGVGILAALTSLLVAAGLTRRITRPLSDLAQAAERLGQGNLEEPIPAQSDWVEINQLAEQIEIFRRMLRQMIQANQQQMKNILRLMGTPQEGEESSTNPPPAEFLTHLAHEFRTPLSSIAASIELLSDEGDGMAPEELAEMVNSIRLSTHHLQAMVDNLLESAIIEANSLRLRYHPLLVRDVIKSSIKMMSPLLKRRQQELVLNVPKEFITVLADPDRLCQVLVNLLDNASKFSPFKSTIQLSVKRLSGALEVEVLDCGPGFPPGRSNDPFKHSFTLNGLRGARYGIGLGLPVVKAIVEAHGGQVGAENRPQGGARVWFTLPLIPPKP